MRNFEEIRQVKRLAGALIGLMLLAAIANGLVPAFPSWPAGLCGWLAALLLLPQIPRQQRRQLALLVIVGLGALGVALAMGELPPLIRLLDTNAGLLTMIAAVSFLRLVAMPHGNAQTALPVGPSAFRNSMIAVALFGCVINISAAILIADRLANNGKLTRLTSQSITRVFSGCPAWSPFFGGMAVVLTYVANTDLLFVMIAGLPFALVGCLYVLLEAKLRYRDDLERFAGYPVTWASLWVPGVLACVVALGYTTLGNTPILIIIALSSLLVTSTVLVSRVGLAGSYQQLKDHVQHGLPGMAGELLLFIAAGILAVGLRALVAAGDIALPLDSFSLLSACLLLGVIVLVAAAGIHPVIPVAVMTPILAPIHPDPQLLAVTYLLGWSLGTCASPLSGTHLIFQGRYGIPSLQGAMWNWPFVAAMYLVGLTLLAAVDWLRSTA